MINLKKITLMQTFTANSQTKHFTLSLPTMYCLFPILIEVSVEKGAITKKQTMMST